MGIVVRVQSEQDIDFIDDLAASCSPLNGALPLAMIRHQAQLQRLGHAQSYPAAMRRIVVRQDRPVGRIMIDWAADYTRCVDIALLPDARRQGIGAALLGAWLTVADRLAVPATLSVRRDNPAIALYRRLGFVAQDDPTDPLLAMSRRP